MNVGEDLNPKFSIFSAVPEDQRAVPAGRRGAGEYFLWIHHIFFLVCKLDDNDGVGDGAYGPALQNVQ